MKLDIDLTHTEQSANRQRRDFASPLTRGLHDRPFIDFCLVGMLTNS